VEQSGSSLGSIPQDQREYKRLELILQWAVREETHVRLPVKFGEAASGVIPSQALSISEKV